MTVIGLKTVASSRNGVGAFILQCKRLHFHYCDWAGSSRGMNAYISSNLPALATAYPQIEFRVSPKPRRHPVIRAEYINGRDKAICVKNLEPSEIQRKAMILVESSGEKNQKIRGKNVASSNENVRGIWSPYHGGIKEV